MSELLREAIVGTANSGVRADTAADALVSKLEGIDRERALLLRAGGEALIRRAARVLPRRSAQLPLAEPDTWRASSLQLTAAVRALLEEESELLCETLTRMARASVRLAPELLPLALEQTSSELRALLRPVLGQRGAWLAQQRPEWTWALASGEGALPSDFELRWADGNAVERRQLFIQARKHDPARARALAAEAWKHERADQRAAFAEAFATGLTAEDGTFLSGLHSDRSALVQRIAARLLWRLPGSAVAQRMLARARAHVRFAPGESAWHVVLPPEPLDPSWVRDGITEKPPDAGPLGPRQWWLQQLIAAVPCATWVAGLPLAAADRTPLSPRQLVAAAAQHEFALPLLDGLTRAALQHDERAWLAPLWDAWARSDLEAAIAPEPRIALSHELTPQQVSARAAQLVSEDKLRSLLPHLPRPWPEALALRVLAAIADLHPAFRDIVSVAAVAIPVALLPDALPLPEAHQVQYPLRSYLRALADFRDIASLRRSIAAETTAD